MPWNATFFKQIYCQEQYDKALVHYCSVHNDGLTVTKTMDEKEPFIIKTAYKGEVNFSVISLEEPEEANAEGLKLVIEDSILKLGWNIKRKNRHMFVSFLH